MAELRPIGDMGNPMRRLVFSGYPQGTWRPTQWYRSRAKVPQPSEAGVEGAYSPRRAEAKIAAPDLKRGYERRVARERSAAAAESKYMRHFKRLSASW